MESALKRFVISGWVVHGIDQHSTWIPQSRFLQTDSKRSLAVLVERRTASLEFALFTEPITGPPAIINREDSKNLWRQRPSQSRPSMLASLGPSRRRTRRPAHRPFQGDVLLHHWRDQYSIRAGSGRATTGYAGCACGIGRKTADTGITAGKANGRTRLSGCALA